MSSKDQDTNIRVICRLRPLNSLEMSQGGLSCVQFTDKTIKIKVQGDENKYDFGFDRIFGPDSTQRQVFEEVAKPVLNSVMNGFNGTIFAYGQTSSGKTFTMEGYSHEDEALKGIIPRVMESIFEMIVQASEDNEYQIKVSMVEIYNEKVNDLLDSSKVNLQIKEDKLKGIFIQNITEVYVASSDHMLAVMKTGSLNRTIAATRMNENSSRSHSLFMVQVLQKNTQNESVKQSKLYFIDLAGSEKISKTNVTGQQLEEAKNINKSLTCLGMVINALTSEKKEHIPYRDSKLTRILQEALGGNSKTTLIIALSMCTYNDKESLGTLRFGNRAKSIKNKPVVNEEKSVRELMLLLEQAERKIKHQEEIISGIKFQADSPQEIKKDLQPDTPTTQKNDVGEQQTFQTGKQGNQSIKLLKQHMQIIQLTEDLEKTQLNRAQLDIELQNKNTQLSQLKDKILQMQTYSSSAQDKLQQKIESLALDLERKCFDTLDVETRFKGMTTHMAEVKQDLNFMLVSFQLRKLDYLQGKEKDQIQSTSSISQIEGEDKISRSINKLLNSIDEVESFLKQRDNSEQDPSQRTEKSGQMKTDNSARQLRVTEILSTETDIDLESCQDKSFQIEEDISEDPEILKTFEILTEKGKLDEEDYLYIYEIVTKQKKTVISLNQKCIDLQQNLENLRLKFETKEQRTQRKLQELTESLSAQIQNNKSQAELYLIQLQDKSQELQNLRHKVDKDLKAKQTEITLQKQQLLELERTLSLQNPTKKILELDNKVKQLAQERQQLFNNLHTSRLECEDKDNKLKQKIKDFQDAKLNEKCLKLQVSQQQHFIAELQKSMSEFQLLSKQSFDPQTLQHYSNVLKRNGYENSPSNGSKKDSLAPSQNIAQVLHQQKVEPNLQSFGLTQTLGLKVLSMPVPIKGGGGNVQRYHLNNQIANDYIVNTQDSVIFDKRYIDNFYESENSFYKEQVQVKNGAQKPPLPSQQGSIKKQNNNSNQKAMIFQSPIFSDFTPSMTQTPRVQDFDNSFYERTGQNDDFQDIMKSNHKEAENKFNKLGFQGQVQQNFVQVNKNQKPVQIQQDAGVGSIWKKLFQ